MICPWTSFLMEAEKKLAKPVELNSESQIRVLAFEARISIDNRLQSANNRRYFINCSNLFRAHVICWTNKPLLLRFPSTSWTKILNMKFRKWRTNIIRNFPNTTHHQEQRMVEERGKTWKTHLLERWGGGPATSCTTTSGDFLRTTARNEACRSRKIQNTFNYVTRIIDVNTCQVVTSMIQWSECGANLF